MKNKKKKEPVGVIMRGGKPSAVILDIDEYQKMLEQLEDIDDLKMLREIRKKSLKFRKLEDFLKEYKPKHHYRGIRGMSLVRLMTLAVFVYKRPVRYLPQPL